MLQLSFLHNEFMQASAQLLRGLKGVRRAYALYYDEQSRDQVLVAITEGGVNQVSMTEVERVEMSRWRQKSVKGEWLLTSEWPFDHGVGRRRIGVQMDLHEEEERNVLVLGAGNLFDHRQDLLFIHFEQHLNHFGLQLSGKKLNTEHKQIIQQLLCGQLENHIEELRQNRAIYAKIMGNRGHIQKQLSDARRELEHRDEFFRRHIMQMVDQWLEQLGRNVPYRFQMSDEALDIIFDYRGGIQTLEKAIREAAEVACNTAYGDSGLLIINAEDLELSADEGIEAKQGFSAKPKNIRIDRYAATEELLERYEQAAQKAQEQKEKIIGRIIGEYCSPPITNAAITDSIRKHRLRILELFKRYPSRWSLIRSEFKSIKKLEEQPNGNLKNAGNG